MPSSVPSAWPPRPWRAPEAIWARRAAGAAAPARLSRRWPSRWIFGSGRRSGQGQRCVPPPTCLFWRSRKGFPETSRPARPSRPSGSLPESSTACEPRPERRPRAPGCRGAFFAAQAPVVGTAAAQRVRQARRQGTSWPAQPWWCCSSCASSDRPRARPHRRQRPGLLRLRQRHERKRWLGAAPPILTTRPRERTPFRLRRRTRLRRATPVAVASVAG
mmetsp:Transcript_4060/g.17005  ORF Transcript_4060/g.17005 Transcript_4060/m.17005 type:complete len:218 (-) Transcript_4060:379-1032(-)